MILIKSAIASILVLAGACDRATSETSSTLPRIDGSSAVVDAGHATPAPASAAGPSRSAAKTLYVCPMHPEVVSEAPGLCPKCNMKLDPKVEAKAAPDSNIVTKVPSLL